MTYAPKEKMKLIFCVSVFTVPAQVSFSLPYLEIRFRFSRKTFRYFLSTCSFGAYVLRIPLPFLSDTELLKISIVPIMDEFPHFIFLFESRGQTEALEIFSNFF